MKITIFIFEFGNNFLAKFLRSSNNLKSIRLSHFIPGELLKPGVMKLSYTFFSHENRKLQVRFLFCSEKTTKFILPEVRKLFCGKSSWKYNFLSCKIHMIYFGMSKEFIKLILILNRLLKLNRYKLFYIFCKNTK